MPRDTSIYPRKGSPFWYCSYYCVQAMRRIHVATPWRVDDVSGKRRALAFATAKSQEAAAFRGAAKHEVWREWVPRFLDDRYRLSPLTYTAATGAWSWWAVFLLEHGVHVPAALTYNHVVSYVAWRTAQKRHCGKPILRNTALQEIRFMGIIQQEAVRRGFANTNPCQRTGLKRDPTKPTAELTDQEIELIRAECVRREGHLPIADQWMTTSFEIALHTLGRLRSTQIPMDWVDFERGEMTMRVKGSKLGEPRYLTVPIHPGIRPRLEALRNAGAVHTCVLPRMASKEWWAFRKALGISHTKFHSTRVTGITRLWRAGVSESFVMRLAGHKSPTVHRIYQRGTTADLASHLEKLSFGQISSSQTPDARPTKS